MNHIKAVIVESELGAGTRGASLGIRAMKVAAQNTGNPFFTRMDAVVAKTFNERLWQKPPHEFARYIDGIVKVFDEVAKHTEDVLKENKFPLVLAGDHSSAGGTIAGIKKHYPNKRIGAIWVDAHADLHSVYTTPSGNIHGMPLAATLNIDNKDNRQRDFKPEDPEAIGWNALKNAGGIAPKVLPSDLVFIGVRSTEPEENALIAQYRIPNHSVAKLRRFGAEAIARETLEHLQDCDLIYISFDVDSLDPSISRGTGTPVEDGFFETEAAHLLLRLVADPKVCCVEVVEVNPCLDDKINTMAEVALRIMDKVALAIENRLSA